MRIFILFTLCLLLSHILFGQVETSKTKLQKLALQIDSLTKDKYGRSAFLDRGLDEDFELYDSLESEYFKRLEKYLKDNYSLNDIKDILITSIDLIEAKNKRIFQWEYISGGTQEETHKIIQILYPDSIQVFMGFGSKTYGLFYFDNAFLEFESTKGCSTCCKERILFNNEEVFKINYRKDYIEQMFTFDSVKQTIEVKLNNIYIEADNNEGYEILNDTLVFHYNGSKFMKKQ